MARNLEEIARQASVAVSTVSRALAGKPGVSPAKRDQILRLARERGLAPDPAASSLRTGQGAGLAVVVPTRTTGIASLRSQAIFRFGREAFGLVRVVVKGDDEPLESAVAQALSQKCRAIVVNAIHGELSGPLVARLVQQRVAYAVVDAPAGHGDQLTIDRAAGTYQAARLLLLNGCREVVVFSNASLDSPDPRLEGMVRGFTSLSRVLEAHQIVPMAGGFQSGCETMRDLLKSCPLDGAFCYSDEAATGALRALAEAGVRVPEDVQVVGFDNVGYSEYGTVPLTTVAQPVDEIAAAAVDCCRRRLGAFDAPPQRLAFPTHLVVRRSAPIARPELRSRVFERPEPVHKEG